MEDKVAADRASAEITIDLSGVRKVASAPVAPAEEVVGGVKEGALDGRDDVESTAKRHKASGAGGAEKGKAAEEVMHLLPCKVASSGPCNVTQFFLPVPAKEDSNALFAAQHDKLKDAVHYGAALRGRQLTGPKIRLPEGASGLVFVEQAERAIGPGSGSKKKKLAAAAAAAAVDGVGAGAGSKRKWQAVSRFEELFVWNRDNSRSERDSAFVEAVQGWGEISAALHDPISIPGEKADSSHLPN